jgi:hypothetical protein
MSFVRRPVLVSKCEMTFGPFAAVNGSYSEASASALQNAAGVEYRYNAFPGKAGKGELQMSEIPIVIVAYYFAFFGFVLEHALLFASTAILLWLLLLVPIKVWTKLLSMIHRPIGHATRRHSPYANSHVPRPCGCRLA